ncbi:MAG TPA: hypothetical protein VEF92_01390 [Burkholderiales bacterium]|nr:hypothetical protein [Burkholderiales bacterium]HYA46181.1 hypothetical protein [Burkholderiales bacterium]
MKPRFARREDLGLSKAEFAVLRRLRTPQKIQEFLNGISPNFETQGQTCLSVREVLRQRRAHCIEGAMLAACALWVHGEPPLLLDLRAERDYDHVVALFRRGRCWGAISKTNPAVLRWRDPVYRSLRELAMSYLHEYANKRHQKTLRSYAGPFDLRRFDPGLWITSKKNCWEVGATLDDLRHRPLLTRAQARGLRLRDAVERKAGVVFEHRPPRKA